MDSELETWFATCRDFAAQALKTNATFDPCIFTFGEHPDANQFVELPWPLSESALNVLSGQFALSRVEAYALVLRDTLTIDGETKDMLLVWMCKRAFTWGRAWEIGEEGLSVGFQECTDPATLRARAFRLLDVAPLSRTDAKALREFIEQSAQRHGAPN